METHRRETILVGELKLLGLKWQRLWLPQQVPFLRHVAPDPVPGATEDYGRWRQRIADILEVDLELFKDVSFLCVVPIRKGEAYLPFVQEALNRYMSRLADGLPVDMYPWVPLEDQDEENSETAHPQAGATQAPHPSR